MECFESEKNNNEDAADIKDDFKLLMEQYKVLENKYKVIVEKVKEDSEAKEELEKKHKSTVDKLQEESIVQKKVLVKYDCLVDKLRDRIECPVCLEVPEAGPISVCPNGHLVCSKCKSYSCPTCRSRMFDGQSLLAVTVLENIEHKCLNLGCTQAFPLAELGSHKKSCDFRLTACPAILCGEKISFCHVIDHVLNHCMHSMAKSDGGVVEIKEGPCEQFYYSRGDEEHFSVDTFQWKDGKYFFLNIRKGPAWTFYVEMLATEDECSKYKVELTVQQSDDSEDYAYTFIGSPIPLEEVKELKMLTGLTIKREIMESKLLKMYKKKMECCISLAIVKK